MDRRARCRGALRRCPRRCRGGDPHDTAGRLQTHVPAAAACLREPLRPAGWIYAVSSLATDGRTHAGSNRQRARPPSREEQHRRPGRHGPAGRRYADVDETATLAAQYRPDRMRKLTPKEFMLDAACGVGDVVQGVRQRQMTNPPDGGATVFALFPAMDQWLIADRKQYRHQG